VNLRAYANKIHSQSQLSISGLAWYDVALPDRGEIMSGNPFCILIAEDHEDNRVALKMMLQLSGYQVWEAADGSEAIEVASKVNPDLILMDISLPTIDGLKATQELRNRAQKMPIIIVSAYDNEEARDNALLAGGTDYVSKPINFDDLKTLIERYLVKSSQSHL
jgi:CheY-like chemotaxis protein